MAGSAKPQKRSRGTIDVLPSGSLRMRVSAGTDPITGRRHTLDEIIPPGPDAAKLAEKARTRLLAQVDEQRNARTKATVNQLLDRSFKWLKAEPNTKENYEALARNHIRPLIGDQPVSKIDGGCSTRSTRSCDMPCPLPCPLPGGGGARYDRGIATKRASKLRGLASWQSTLDPYVNKVEWMSTQANRTLRSDLDKN
jgi:hypothetical protein